ncbi:hypothetical protein AYK24_00600 [Thermoplasmatales archaeon SG8-52-4]|nr:MAG: hypothetical protein AYK24_00600 [Thermoplasmatales archaeon SG8-52-4]
MLDGVYPEEPGSPKEMALIFMKHRQNRIKSMETYLISKALFISGTENLEDKNKQVNEYNKLLNEYQDLINPSKIADRKKFERTFKEKAKDLGGKTLTDLLGDKKLSLGKKPKEDFSKTITTKNWSKVK